MPDSPLVPIIDGHNDVLLRMMQPGQDDPVAGFLEGEGRGHIDLPRAKAGGLAGGFLPSSFPPRIIGQMPTEILLHRNRPPP